MHETTAEIDELQALLDRSYARSGAHLQSIITPERRLNARQVGRLLDGVKQIALATVTPRGEPRVSPVDALFLHGRFYFGTAESALRSRHLRRNPAVSASHYVGDTVAVTVHGRVSVIEEGTDEARLIEQTWLAVYGFSPFDREKWLAEDLSPEVVFFRIDAESMITYAQSPGDFEESSL